MMEEIETNYYKVKEANDFKDDTDTSLSFFEAKTNW